MDLNINNFILDELEKYMLYNINIISEENNNNINKEKLSKIFKYNSDKDNSNKDNSNKDNKIQHVVNYKDNKKNLSLSIKEDLTKYKILEKYDKSLFIPKHQDKLFWSLYILKYGLNKYNLNYNNRFSVEKELKINAVTFMKTNKHNVKVKKTEVESNLLFDKKLSMESLSLLSNYLNINIRVVFNKYYYDFLNNENENYFNIFYNNNYGVNLDNNYNVNIDDKLLILNPNKPINSISYYKLDDLYNLAKKLQIEILNHDNKKKNKKELYDEIYKVFLN